MTAIYADDQQILLKTSQRATAAYYLQSRHDAGSGLYYFRRRYYSAEFYSAGQARVSRRKDIDSLLRNGNIDFLVIRRDDMKYLSETDLASFKLAQPFGQFVVLEEIAPNAAQSARDESTSSPPPS
jgi:hypothetical protein